MPDFQQTICNDRRHCRMCRRDPAAFESRMRDLGFDLPQEGIEQCPFGVTRQSLGMPPLDPIEPIFADWKKDICRTCDQFISFPDDSRIECRAMQSRRGCACLRRRDTCPLGKWTRHISPSPGTPGEGRGEGLPSSDWSSRPRWWKNRHPNIDSLSSPITSLKTSLKTLFDAIWCINLDHSRQRWSDFTTQLENCNWPFGPVRRFAAIHGDTVGVPNHFHQGGGAWGCLQSHRRVLELSLMQKCRRILVLEDDADLRPHFGDSVRRFLSDLGDQSWDCLMLGGQHMSPPRPVKPGIVRPTGKGIQRTHCMAMTAPFMRALYRMWSSPLDQHCDWSLGPFAVPYKTFAPTRFIVGQRGGQSLIAGSTKPPEWWNPPPDNAPILWLRAPREVLESCRDLFHSGYRRAPDGSCLGLAQIFRPGALAPPSTATAVEHLRRWIAMIQWESTSRGDGSLCTIWHPHADESLIRPAAGDALRIIDAQTVPQARSAMAHA